MDYRLYHAVNEFVAAHAWVGHAAAGLESWAIPAFAIATFALWLLARPGAAQKWKLACASALASAGMAFVVNQAVAQLWSRPRPFAAHPDAVVWGGRSHDPSFPSDHSAAAFAIAAAVFMFDRLVGSLFLAAASAISLGRVVSGVHYPADIVAGALVGVACAALVVRVGRPLTVRLVGVVERITDPVLRRALPLAGSSAGETVENHKA